jgi:hypothetical protein
LDDKWNNVLLMYQDTIIESITSYKSAIATLEDLGSMLLLCRHSIIVYLAHFFTGTCGFKSSAQKKDPELQMLLCNLHLQELRVQDLQSDG